MFELLTTMNFDVCPKCRAHTPKNTIHICGLREDLDQRVKQEIVEQRRQIELSRRK